jgi:hypothetical protein
MEETREDETERIERQTEEPSTELFGIQQSFIKKVFFIPFLFFFFSEKLGSLDVCREKLQGERMASSPPPLSTPTRPVNQSASQLTEQGRDVCIGFRGIYLIQISLRRVIRH